MAGIQLSADLSGVKALTGRLEAIDRTIARQVLGRILTAAARPLVAGGRAQAPVRLGHLQASFGQVLRKTREWRPYVVMGPESGYQASEPTRRGTRTVVPAYYAHLVHGGTGPHSLESAVDMKAIRRGRTVFNALAERELAAAGENIGVATRRYRALARTLARDYLLRRDRAAGRRTHPGARANPWFARVIEAGQAQAAALIEGGLRAALESGA